MSHYISCELSQTNIKPLSNEVRLARTPTWDKEQKEKLKKVFLDWKGDLEQVDDICVIGRGLSNEARLARTPTWDKILKYYRH